MYVDLLLDISYGRFAPHVQALIVIPELFPPLFDANFQHDDFLEPHHIVYGAMRQEGHLGLVWGWGAGCTL